ncbi:hypothetical protein [Cronobacter phage vB_Cdu_VP8]|nr:hypothetical protein [Cronobacter phage vB_Cdu_VP8]
MEILEGIKLRNKTRAELEVHLKEIHRECAARWVDLKDGNFSSVSYAQYQKLKKYHELVKSVLTHKEHTGQR